jgi:hypothetical protein
MVRSLTVRLLGPDGKPLSKDVLGSLYAADLHFEPIRRRSEIAPDGVVQIETPDNVAAFHAQVSVPGFGTVWAIADNEGEGYRQHGTPIDFIRDAAASRLARVRLNSATHSAPSSSCHAAIW